MINIRTLFPVLIAGLALVACKKGDGESNPGGGLGTGIGEKRPVGTALENPKTAVIGANGGTLVSRDGKLEISIPAGSLSSNTTIGVAAINSTSDAALGNAYRIMPHLNFTKPVTITISYADHADSLGGGCAASLGFQDTAGVWQLVLNRTLNEEKQKISVQTTHFSDWSVLTPVRLTPAVAHVQPNDEVVLTVGSWMKLNLPGKQDPCTLLSSPSAETIPMEHYFTVPKRNIERWISMAGTTEGAGKLTVSEDGIAKYKLSNHDAPAINPVGILAYWPNNIVPMKATIYIRPVSLGLFITIGNTTYVYDNAYAYGSGGDNGVIWKKDYNGKTFNSGMNWHNDGTGTKNWSNDNQFYWEPETDEQPTKFYFSYWDDGLKISNGTVEVSKFGAVGEIVEGTFKVSNAGQYRSATGTTDVEYLGVKAVNGSFRVIRK